MTFIFVFLFILVIAWTTKGLHVVRREEVYSLIQNVIDHKSVLKEWEMFIVYPINGNAELEAFRKQCNELDSRTATGMEKMILNQEGERELKSLFIKLQKQRSIEF